MSADGLWQSVLWAEHGDGTALLCFVDRQDLGENGGIRENLLVDEIFDALVTHYETERLNEETKA